MTEGAQTHLGMSRAASILLGVGALRGSAGAAEPDFQTRADELR